MSIVVDLLRRIPNVIVGRDKMRRLDFVLPYVRGKDVLDVGVVQHSIAAYEEPGWLHGHVTRAAASCVGIDFLEEGITFLRSKGYDVVQADAEDFELGRSFDVIVAGEVLEHLSNPRGFLLSARRHLRSEGRLVITTPNPWFFAYSWLALFGEPPENTEHTAWYTLGTLRELLRRAGFELERAEYGSGQDRPYRLPFAPDRVRHNSLWVVARLSPTGPEDHPRPPGS